MYNNYEKGMSAKEAEFSESFLVLVFSTTDKVALKWH